MSAAAVLHLHTRPADVVPDALLRVDEVARLLRVSTRTVREWIKAGAIVATRLGPRRRIVRVEESEIAKLVARGRRT